MQTLKTAFCLLFCLSTMLCGCSSAEPFSPAPEHAIDQSSLTSTDTTTATTTTTTTTSNTALQAKPTIPISANGKRFIDIPVISQYPRFPTGCEAVATVMALNYAGYNITVDDFVDNHLPRNSNFYWEDGKYYGPDPNKYFLGNPRSENSYGCMSPVIKEAVIHYTNDSGCIIDASRKDFKSLCNTYINKGVPVIVWVSIGMIPITDGPTWITPDGNQYTWPTNEHCMLLVGYDNTYYYFNDPYRGRVLKFDKAKVEQRYETMGKQALVII